MQSAAQINISNPATTNAKAAKRGAEADTIAAVNIGAISSAKLLITRVRFTDLTTIRRKFVSPISAFTQEGIPIKRKHEFFIIRAG